MREAAANLGEQFEDLEQQQEASRLGMWVFLATEVMFFGGLFLGYTVYRHAYPHAFAVASRQTNVMFGTINTAVLLTSSLAMVLAVHAAQLGRTKAVVRWLQVTLFLAGAFLIVKGFEYRDDFDRHLVPGYAFAMAKEPGAELFFYFYWAMTGLHALHVLIGMGVLSVIACMASRGRYSESYYNPVEISGLYWHFVDLVWIFLYPLLYLIDRHA